LLGQFAEALEADVLATGGSSVMKRVAPPLIVGFVAILRRCWPTAPIAVRPQVLGVRPHGASLHVVEQRGLQAERSIRRAVEARFDHLGNDRIFRLELARSRETAASTARG